ncbi:lysoplasmalogenase [Flavobacterium sp. MMLR14_040]|uniref:lysoplasmalogenase n=1 Tax=Flavobacterium sp. MMLR14_040 TaxID=3093843 RepID=UPI00298FD0AE|nr:lysoplasmalogenase [Flavobacterium sp. MMLR14_040]MDW8852652.1 lysoplasmalogenase [Flavobacterium sp. MMLR14_040]
MKHTLFFKIYFFISLIYLLVQLFGYEYLDLYLKPTLIPLLAFAVYAYKRFPSRNSLLTALAFSWVGDIVLLFADIAEIYFIVALASFLISHLIYCTLFNKQKTVEIRNNIVFRIGCLIILLYVVGMISFLLPTLGTLKVPVIIYAFVISTMLLFAFNGFLSWSKPGNKYVFYGAVIFVVSDSILAINKFYIPIQKGSFFIMVTYLVAQYLIVDGIVKMNPKKAD